MQRHRPVTRLRASTLPRARARRSRCPAILPLALLLQIGSPVAATATDLSYGLMSPNFGGTDSSAFQFAQYEKALKDQRAANAAAAAKVSTGPDPNQQFANAIISQLNSLVARDVALKIANSQPGDAGTIQSGNVSVTYVNSDGQLNVVIATPTGSTSLSVPTGQ